MQVEAGSVATAFQTATGTIQGELAACQRYYYQVGGTGSLADPGNGHYYLSTQAYILTFFPVTMRTAPSGSITNLSSWSIYSAGTPRVATSYALSTATPVSAMSAVGTSVAVPGDGCWLETTNTNGLLSFSAEL